ncbi:MAG: uL15m family ribosomal protein [Candidatus Woesearchaeota archaeon]
MTVNKRKKNSRARANTTHGYGSMKKNRGAGNRGGRGRAGSGKKGDARKPFFRVKEKFELGKNGFGKKRIKIEAINVSDLEKRKESLLLKGVMTKNKETYVINLGDMKVDKLLASGNVASKFDVKVRYASDSAVEKIKKAGGNVVLLEKKADEASEEESSDAE